MRNRQAVANAGRELPLPLQHGLKHILYSRSPHSFTGTRPSSIPIHEVGAMPTASAVGASSIIATVRVPAGKIAGRGIIYGRICLSDITQTMGSPEPTGAVVPVYTFGLGGTWSRRIGPTNVGATLA